MYFKEIKKTININIYYVAYKQLFQNPVSGI
jgi:hypothetical protein